MQLSEYRFEDLPNLLAENNRRLAAIEALLLTKQPQQPPSEFIDITEASRVLNLTVPSIYSMVSRGQLPSSKRGKKLYFSREELSAYVRAGRRLTNEEIKQQAVLNAGKAMTKGGVM